MKTPTIAMVSVAEVTALGVLVPACSSNSNSGSPSSTTSSGTATSSASAASTSGQAAPFDYTTLLIQGSDIQAAPDVFTATAPATQNPDGKPGAAVQFQNKDNTNKIGDTIQILSDAAGATTALNAALGSIGGTVSGGTPQPVPVGTGGTLVAGTSQDKSKAVSVLLFTEGKALTTLEFDGANPTDAVSPDFAVALAQVQDTNIKNKLLG